MTSKVGKRLICLLFPSFQTLAVGQSVNRLGGRKGEGGGSRARKGRWRGSEKGGGGGNRRVSCTRARLIDRCEGRRREG
jgi:hypothetical protein